MWGTCPNLSRSISNLEYDGAPRHTTVHHSRERVPFRCVTPPSLRVQLQAASVLGYRVPERACEPCAMCVVALALCLIVQGQGLCPRACSRARTPALETVGLGGTGSGSCIGGRGAAHAHCGVLSVHSL